MQHRIPNTEMSKVFSLALQQKGLIDAEDTALIFYDLSFLQERIENLLHQFPPSTLHTIAIKANPLTRILLKMEKLGVGLEAATLPELYLAEKAGFPPERIVFDSPAKTMAELEYALKLGVHINADSFAELARIDELLKKRPSQSTIGVRINPQIGTGNIMTTSVAGEYSKFGIPINENRKALMECFLKYDWLGGVHVHVGSQGCALPLLLDGVAVVFKFANEINEALENNHRKRKVALFDIGGGVPVSYGQEQAEPAISMAQYTEALNLRCNGLFSGKFRLITEFGRYVHANAGWVASRVEYVKPGKQVNTVMAHVGADMFLRKCYKPDDWHHDISVLNAQGNLKSGRDNTPYNIAGPLCFAGDIIAREIDLPPVEKDDIILIHDAGAYTLSMWSRYNSRQIPKVIGYYQDGAHFEILKQREQLEQIWAFWS
jgi:diaminopimelate decarboxylase